MHLDSFIVSALLMLAVTSVAVALFCCLRLGAVLGLLIAGVVVGPHSPGPFVTAHVEDVRNFAELGVVLLLFVIGLEMKPSRLWSLRRDLFGLGSLQILLAGLAITLYVSLAVESWKTALLIGLTLSLSSTAFVMQLLRERGEFASSHGTGAFAVLLMQDLSVVPLLALVPLLSNTAAITSGIPLWEQLLILGGMFAVLWVFGLHVVPFALEWLARRDNSEAFLLVVLLAVFLAAWAMHKAGVSMALGAFIMAVGVISLSMLFAPLLVRFGNALDCRLEGQRCVSQWVPAKILDAPEQRVLIGGYGRVGHTVATLLQVSGIPFVAFDVSPERVEGDESQ